MKKEVLLSFILLSFILTISFVFADSNATTIEEKAYSCLKDNINKKISSLSLEEKSFSLLALAYDSSLQSSLISKINDEKNDNCFPNKCKVKDTALVIIALNYAKQNTEESEGWLIDKEIRAKNINVFLEIDTNEKSNCTIKWDGGSAKISISEDKKVSGGGSCFDSATNGYWLKIKDSCLNKNFTVSCSKDFITTLLYQKSSEDIWYVSDDVKSASANGETQHVSNLSCFSDNGKDCDYEASLWATLALQRTGHNIDNLIPYLILFASDNQKLFPDSFLYYLTNSEDYLNNIVGLQKNEGYWDLASVRGKYYDTALALLVIQSASSDAKSSAESWLTEKQDSSGCWNNNNIRDTAFLLWANWPKQASAVTVQENCIDKGYYCLSKAECGEAGGNILDNYYCSGLKECCSKPLAEKRCSEKDKLAGYSGKGEICQEGKVCSVSLVSASDTDKCCLGSCEESTATECENYGYLCKNSCSSDEEEANYNCNGQKVCCRPKEEPSTKKSWVIWLLIILIIVVIVLIILRNRIKILLFKKRSGIKEGNVGKMRPPFVPPSAGSGIPRAQYSQTKTIPPLRTIPTQLPIRQPIRRDRELEETMKKLREMSR